MYKIQEQLLEVTGPLVSLWVELLQPDAELTKEEIVLQLQRALVLLGSTSHAINVERRKVAWARINPNLSHWQRKTTRTGRVTCLVQVS